MGTLDERVAFLEGRVEEHARQGESIRDAMSSLERRMDARLEAFELRMDRRFEAMDLRFEAIDRRFEAIDRRFEAIDRRFEAIDDKFSRYFVWMLGAQVTTLAAIVTAFATLLAGR